MLRLVLQRDDDGLLTRVSADISHELSLPADKYILQGVTM
jgi:hypothetical protein